MDFWNLLKRRKISLITNEEIATAKVANVSSADAENVCFYVRDFLTTVSQGLRDWSLQQYTSSDIQFEIYIMKGVIRIFLWLHLNVRFAMHD